MAYRSSTTNSGNTWPPSVAVPAGAASTDIATIILSLDNGSLTLVSGDEPTGFTQLAQADCTADGQTTYTAQKQLSAGDTGTYTFRNAIGGTFDWVCHCVLNSGRHATNPSVIGTAGILNTAANNPTVSAPGVTALSGDDLIMISAPDVKASGVGAGHTPPSTFTERQDVQNNWANLAVFTKDNVSAGATGSITSAFTTTGTNTAGYVAWLIRLPAAPSGTITGDAAITEAADTISSAGTLAIAGTLAKTEAADTLAAAGAVGLTGAAAITEAGDTLSAAGAITSGTTETIFNHATEPSSPPTSIADAPITLGIAFAPQIAGFINAIYFWKTANDTATARQVRLYAHGNSTAVASGSTTGEPTGVAQWIRAALTAPYAVANPTLYLAAVHWPDAAGRWSKTDNWFATTDDPSSGGNVLGLGNVPTRYNGAYETPSASITYPTQVSPADANYWVDVEFATASSGTITGAAAITEAGDTASGAGTLAIAGAAAITEAADTILASAAAGITGTAAITEASDSVASAGALAIAGAMAKTEAADTVTAAGGRPPLRVNMLLMMGGGTYTGILGDLAKTEANDNISAAGTLAISGAATVTEAADTIVASSGVTVTGVAAITEASDSVVASGSVPLSGAATIVESDDTLWARQNVPVASVACAGSSMSLGLRLRLGRGR